MPDEVNYHITFLDITIFQNLYCNIQFSVYCVYQVPTLEFNTPATLIKKINMSDGIVSRVLDLQSPPASCDASGSASGSGSKKNHVLRSQPTSDESSGSAEKKQM